jgi:hypothetical protein
MRTPVRDPGDSGMGVGVLADADENLLMIVNEAPAGQIALRRSRLQRSLYELVLITPVLAVGALAWRWLARGSRQRAKGHRGSRHRPSRGRCFCSKFPSALLPRLKGTYAGKTCLRSARTPMSRCCIVRIRRDRAHQNRQIYSVENKEGMTRIFSLPH